MDLLTERQSVLFPGTSEIKTTGSRRFIIRNHPLDWLRGLQEAALSRDIDIFGEAYSTCTEGGTYCTDKYALRRRESVTAVGRACSAALDFPPDWKGVDAHIAEAINSEGGGA